MKKVNYSEYGGRIDCLELKDYDGRIEKVCFDISRRFEVGYLLLQILKETEGIIREMVFQLPGVAEFHEEAA